MEILMESLIDTTDRVAIQGMPPRKPDPLVRVKKGEEREFDISLLCVPASKSRNKFDRRDLHRACAYFRDCALQIWSSPARGATEALEVMGWYHYPLPILVTISPECGPLKQGFCVVNTVSLLGNIAKTFAQARKGNLHVRIPLMITHMNVVRRAMALLDSENNGAATVSSLVDDWSIITLRYNNASDKLYAVRVNKDHLCKP